MNKREVADELGCSTRQVEKYVGLERLHVVEYVRGKSGREGVYDPAEVERLKVELENERSQVIGHAPAPMALTAPKQSQAIAVFEQFNAGLERQHTDTERIIEALTTSGVKIPDKLILTLPDAALLTSLSVGHLRGALRADGRLTMM